MLKKRTTVKKTCKPVRKKKGNWSLFGLGKKKKVRGSGKGLIMAKNKSEAKKEFEKLGVTVTKVTKNRKGGYNVYHRV